MSTKVNFYFVIAFVFLMLSVSTAQPPLPSNLKATILRELQNYYGAGAEFEIAVNAAGDVRINGSAASYWDKRNVQAIVSRVRGVVLIENELIVTTKKVPDGTIKTNIEAHLRDNMAIAEPEKIRVSVDSGSVTLRGEVNFTREVYLAEDVASWQRGVTDVVNALIVLPQEIEISDKRLAQIINNLITRFFLRTGNSIEVAVQDGKVTLSGGVDSLWTRRQITKEVRRIQGVKSVDNQLKVGLSASKK